jgi:hypothetical protein
MRYNSRRKKEGGGAFELRKTKFIVFIIILKKFPLYNIVKFDIKITTTQTRRCTFTLFIIKVWWGILRERDKLEEQALTGG